MKMDMANFAVGHIRPHLVQQSVEYERSKFQEFLDRQPSECLRVSSLRVWAPMRVQSTAPVSIYSPFKINLT